MKLRFHVTFGENVIEIPDSQAAPADLLRGSRLHDLWRSTVTLYHRTPSGEFERRVIRRCFVGDGGSDKTSGVVTNVVSEKTALIKAVSAYLAPEEYHALAEEARRDFFTVQVGDFVVLHETDEEVTTAKAFSDLQAEHRTDGFKVMNVGINIHGLTVDHIALSSV